MKNSSFYNNYFLKSKLIYRNFKLIKFQFSRSNVSKQQFLDNKVYDRTFPYYSFYLSTQEAYWVNEHDRNLLLLKSNNVIESEKKTFFFDMMSELNNVKKLFPFLKGTKHIVEYFLNNTDDFNKSDLNNFISRLESLKIFSHDFEVFENESNEPINLKFVKINTQKNELVQKVIQTWAKRNLVKNKKLIYSDFAVILEYLSLVEFEENKSFLRNLFDYIDLNSLDFNKQTRLLYLTMKIDKNFIVENMNNKTNNLNHISMLKMSNEILNRILNEKDSSNTCLYEISQFLEVIGKLSTYNNDNAIHYMFNKLKDKLSKIYRDLHNESLRLETSKEKIIDNKNLENINANKNNSFHFIILYKLLEINCLSKSKSVNLDLIFLILNKIDYRFLNQMEKLYFHQILNYILIEKEKNSEILELEEELSVLLSKYKQELFFKQNVNVDFTQYLGNAELLCDYRNKIFYSIDYFEKNSKALSLDKINICNSILTYS